MSSKNILLPRFRLGVLVAAAALAPPGVALASSAWGSVGSTGILDEACYANVRLNFLDARLAPGATQATCTLRYQISDTFGLDSGQSYTVFLNSHLLDNGAYARVEVRLRSYAIFTGSTALLTTINSDTATGSTLPNGYRSINSGNCFTLNFNRFHYWVEVTLVRLASPTTSGPGMPAIARVGLEGCLF